jgi:predicted ATPase
VGPGSSIGRAGDTDYMFRHAVVREAAYATLTDADRVLGHRLAADWLERQGRASASMLAAHRKLGGAR